MSHRYTLLPNPGHSSQHDREAEMEAAFDASDDEDAPTETQPLNPEPSSSPIAPSRGSYNFESVDYDYPPPGSPPSSPATTVPSINIGNSNGFIPTFTSPLNRGPQRMWFQRAATAVLPSSISSRIGLTPQRLTGPIGGGTNNDGVFSNVTAKPSAPIIVQDGGDTYIVPEETQQEAPPSYASAQADAVPPYWETTVHAPFASDSIGDMVIDNLPTGTFFSFCWNFLVSISFQFVGFLLTYLLHTSHAARLGSRAGLGVTLIQYGFALRSRIDSTDEAGKGDWDWPEPGNTALGQHGPSPNATWTTAVANTTQGQATTVVTDSTTEWFSFFLMTIGWFVLLTSLLGFWRVKRWEREVLASRNASLATPAPQVDPNLVSQVESTFGLRGMTRIELLRQGLGFSSRYPGETAAARAVSDAEEGEQNPMLAFNTSDPERARAIAADAQLRRALTEAGFF